MDRGTRTDVADARMDRTVDGQSTQEGRTACTCGTDRGRKGQTENADARQADGEAVCVCWADGQMYKA